MNIFGFQTGVCNKIKLKRVTEVMEDVFSFVFVASPADRPAENQRRGESSVVNDAAKYPIHV